MGFTYIVVLPVVPVYFNYRLSDDPEVSDDSSSDSSSVQLTAVLLLVLLFREVDVVVAWSSVLILFIMLIRRSHMAWFASLDVDVDVRWLARLPRPPVALRSCTCLSLLLISASVILYESLVDGIGLVDELLATSFPPLPCSTMYVMYSSDAFAPGCLFTWSNHFAQQRRVVWPGCPQ